MKNIILSILIIVSGFFVIRPTYSQTNARFDSLKIQHKKHKHPFPLWIESIKIGKTPDSVIIKKFGPGIFDSSDGHGGARYYIDARKLVMLKTVIGVDYIIEEASLSDITFPFDFVKSTKSFPTNAISSRFSIFSRTESNLSLGMPEEMVIKLLGTPNRIDKNGELKILFFEDSNNEWIQVIFYQATFVFRKNKLIRMTLYNGE